MVFKKETPRLKCVLTRNIFPLVATFYIITIQLFHDGGPYHTETSLLICSANQWTGFYIIGTSVMKELKD